MDSPVSGGPEGAKSASLAIMAGGDENIFNQIKEILKQWEILHWLVLLEADR